MTNETINSANISFFGIFTSLATSDATLLRAPTT